MDNKEIIRIESSAAPSPELTRNQEKCQTVNRVTETGTCSRCGGLVSREAGVGRLYKCHRCASVQCQSHYPPI